MNVKLAILTGAAVVLATGLFDTAAAQAALAGEISDAAPAAADAARGVDTTQPMVRSSDQPAPLNLSPLNLTLPPFDFSQPNLSDNGPGSLGAAPPALPIAGGTQGALVGSPQSGPTPGIPAF